MVACWCGDDSDENDNDWWWWWPWSLWRWRRGGLCMTYGLLWLSSVFEPTVRSGRSPLCITKHVSIIINQTRQYCYIHSNTEKLKLSLLSTNSKSIWYWISSKLADSLIASLMVFQITHEIKFNLTCEWLSNSAVHFIGIKIWPAFPCSNFFS